MVGVERPFAEYSQLSGFRFSQMVHFWLSHRILGDPYWLYLMPSVLVGIAVLFVVWWGVRRTWPSLSGVAFIALGLLSFNALALYFAKYAVFDRKRRNIRL